MRDINDFRFDGPFAGIIPSYVQYKRSCGYKVAEAELYRLREIDRFFRDAGVSQPAITRDMYEKWAGVRNNERPVNTSRRRTALSMFGKYLLSNGYTDVYIGDGCPGSFESDYVPYVFSKEEISQMFSVMDEKCVREPGYANDAFRTMVSMYYCCGFRKSEVVSLHIKDVDLQAGKVTVLNGKNDVSRIVIVSDSLLSHIKEFYKTYHTGSHPEDFLFHGTKHKSRPFCKPTLYSMYHKLLKDAGVPDRPDGRIHRLHDLRHTFCVCALEQMQQKGFDLYTSLPLLSTYLGHRHIRETEYYLRLVESRQDSVLEKTKEYMPGLFPEIGDAENE